MPKSSENKFKKKNQTEQEKLYVQMSKKRAAASKEQQTENVGKNVRKKNRNKKSKNPLSANGPVDSKVKKINKARPGELRQQQEDAAQQASPQKEQKVNKKKKNPKKKASKTKEPMANTNQESSNKAEINPKAQKRAAPATAKPGAKKPKIKLENPWKDTTLSDSDLYKIYGYNYEDVTTDSNSDCSMTSTDDTYSMADEFESDYDYDYDSESDASYLSHHDNASDRDYVLPEHVPEDLRIHRGTAEKRALRKEDNVVFASDDDEPQIIELPKQQLLKSVQQPEGYQREVICKLHEAYYARTSFLLSSESGGESSESLYEYSSESTECPDLVPIEQPMEAHVITVKKDSSHVPLYAAYGRTTQSHKVQEDVDWQIIKQSYKAGTRCRIITCAAFDERDDEAEEVAAIPASSGVEEEKEADRNSDSPNSAEKAENDPSMSSSDDEQEKEADRIRNTPEIEEDIDSQDSAGKAENGMEAADSGMPSNSPKAQKATGTVAYIYSDSVNMPWVLVLLKEPLYFYGTVRCQLLQGAVEIYGYQPALKEEVEIFSPRGCSTVQVSPVRDSGATVEDLASQFHELEQQFSQRKLTQMLAAYEPQSDALILLKRNAPRRALLQTFKQNMSENVFPHIHTVRKETHDNYSHECLLDCVLNTENERAPLHIPAQWQQIEMHRQSKILLAGGKAVGKSTLLRYLVNRHLKQFSQLLVIDLDIGQSELFLPETISCFVVSTPLLGPGFFYNQQPAKAIAVGGVNVVLCKEQYLGAIEELLSFCNSQQSYGEMPWLVNTMGYNKGFGLELIAMIAKLCRPSAIIQLQSNKAINNFDAVLEADVLGDVLQNMLFNEPLASLNFSYHLHMLDSPVLQEGRYKKKWEMGPKDMRYAMVLSRLSAAMADECMPLKDCVPLSIPLEDLRFVNLLNRQESKLSALQAVNIGWVYLCRWLSEEIPLECIGAGFLRSVDLPGKRVYVLPAMPYERMYAVNCVAFGEMELPTSFILGQNTWEETLSTYVYTSHNADSSKAIKQIFHRSPQFLTGKHKSILE